MIDGWQGQGGLDYASLSEAQRAVVESFLEQAGDDAGVVAVQLERDPEGLLLANVWADSVTARLAALVDECQAEGSRAGVSFVALRLARGIPAPEPESDTLWLTRPGTGIGDSPS